MALCDLTRQAVSQAIEEFDKEGRDKTLKKYGFRHAFSYFLIHGERRYDSKAIVGIAHGFQFGEPLKPGEFSGGKATVQRILHKLGFEVVACHVDDSTSAFPEEVPEDTWEGAKRTISVNRYERDTGARLACIESNGTCCRVCGFEFADVYGKEFAGFIHVHHVTPLSKIKARHKVNPTEDLVPVCANCHAVIHYGNRTRSVDAVKKLIRKSSPKRTG